MQQAFGRLTGPRAQSLGLAPGSGEGRRRLFLRGGHGALCLRLGLVHGGIGGALRGDQRPLQHLLGLERIACRRLDLGHAGVRSGLGLLHPVRGGGHPFVGLCARVRGVALGVVQARQQPLAFAAQLLEGIGHPIKEGVDVLAVVAAELGGEYLTFDVVG